MPLTIIKPYTVMFKFKPALLGLLFASYNLAAQSPGGISHHSFWLQEKQPANQQQQTLNFNSFINVSENKGSIKLPDNIRSIRRITVFTVYQNTSEAESPVWQVSGGVGDLSLSNKQISSTSGKSTLLFVKNKPANEAILHTYIGNTGMPPSSGNESSLTPGNVKLAEFILYEKILPEQDVAKIETYLALKYGITLQKNYVSASGAVLWNYKFDSSYSNNIAGIARDDKSSLYQKQSTSSNAAGQLVIGTGKMNDRDYLIWGDNSQPLAIKDGTLETMFASKKWLMKRSGDKADKISTELKINAASILSAFPKDSFYLVIDRSGTGEFSTGNCTYLKPDNITEEGIASFKDVHWDVDGSGKDAFTFAVKPAMLLVKEASTKDAVKLTGFQLYPNPVRGGRYNMMLTLDKPADIEVRVYDMHQKLVHSAKATGQSSYIFPGQITGAAGAYTVRVITPQTEYSRIIIVQ